jgi:hypothetical protein
VLAVLYLLSLVAILIGFLRWRRTPRVIVFDLLLASTWIFVFGFNVTLGVFAVLAPDWMEGLVPYIPPVIPVAIFVAWVLRRLTVRPRGSITN